MAKRARRTFAGVVVLALIAGIGVVAVVGLGYWDRYSDRLFSRERCVAQLDGEERELTAQQANNAALIAAASAERNLAARAATIALATAIQESDLRNIDYGDRDSVGLFQQRPSQGWGSVEQIMDPYYSTEQFYDGLVQVNGWRELPITEAAQAVQRSAFPEAYGQHETTSRLWASALRGHSGPVAITCTLGRPGTTSPDAFAERVEQDFGSRLYDVEMLEELDGRTVMAVTARSGSRQDTNALAAWAVAVASVEAIVAVSVAGEGWSRDRGDDSASGPLAETGVTVEIVTES